MVELSYIAHSCFKIKNKDTTIITDPYDPVKSGMKFPKVEADVVLSSHNHYDHNYIQGVSNYKLVIDTPGEFEVSGNFIYGIPTFHDASGGTERGTNVMYLLDLDGFTILHTGDLGHEFAKETLDKISSVDVLLIPVGGTYTINAKIASKIISALEPAIVIPMHYKTDKPGKVNEDLDTLEKFLDEMGADKSAKKVDKLKLSSRSDIPTETQIVILTPQY